MYSEQNMILYTVLCTLQYTAILSFSQKVTSEVCECGVSSGVRCEGGSDVSWWGGGEEEECLLLGSYSHTRPAVRL